MSKLNLNANSLNRSVIPNIEYAIDKLNSAINSSSQLVVPTDFKYAASLKQLLEGIVTIRNNLNSIKDWTIQSNREIDNTLKEIENELNSIKNTEIKKRESAIK